MSILSWPTPEHDDHGPRKYVLYKNREGDIVCRRLICQTVVPLVSMFARFIKSGNQAVVDNAAQSQLTTWVAATPDPTQNNITQFNLTTGIYTVPANHQGVYTVTFGVEWQAAEGATGVRVAQVTYVDPAPLAHIIGKVTTAPLGAAVAASQTVACGPVYMRAGGTILFEVQATGVGANTAVLGTEKTFVAIARA